MKQILVTCAIIKNDNKFLITQRTPSQHNALRWEFPGGTLEFGEDPRTCLQREIDEELGIKVKTNEIMEISSNVYDKVKHVVLIAFHCNFLEGEIKKQDINDFKWVTSEEMKNYDITEADIPFIKVLNKK